MPRNLTSFLCRIFSTFFQIIIIIFNKNKTKNESLFTVIFENWQWFSEDSKLNLLSKSLNSMVYSLEMSWSSIYLYPPLKYILSLHLLLFISGVSRYFYFKICSHQNVSRNDTSPNGRRRKWIEYSWGKWI